MGSVIEGEDVVQDTFAKALVALEDIYASQRPRAWLFRVAHNRALDLLRGRAIRAAEPIEAADEVVDDSGIDPMEMLIRREALETAVTRFTELPVIQRSVIILKDVLDEPLTEIASLLDITIDAVKGHLARGRARLRLINAQSNPPPRAGEASSAVLRYVSLFNQQDWDGLRALLADDVKLQQSSHPLRSGAADVGVFFTIYSKSDGIWLAPAWLEDREVIAVFDGSASPKPSHIMRLEWRDGCISFIRDYRYVGYVVDSSDLVMLSDTKPTFRHHTHPKHQ
jgi:RNA polymerase sigma-70 factor (ECF subfamily)